MSFFEVINMTGFIFYQPTFLLSNKVLHTAGLYISPQNPSDVPNESRPPPPPLLKIPVPIHGHEEVAASTRELPLEQSPQDHRECQTPAHSSHPSPSSPPHIQSTPPSPQESSDGRKIIAQILDK